MGRLANEEYADSHPLTSTGKFMSSITSIAYDVPHSSGNLLTTAMSAVLPYLGARCLGMIQQANKQLSIENEAWKILCLRDFGILRASDSVSWKFTYKLAWNEWVVWNDGYPDYVQFLGSRDGHGIWSKMSRNGNTVEVMITM